jgi:alpha-maltose-1-phosphate synthase
MRVWLPYVAGDSGADVWTKLLARGLHDLGHEVIVTRFAHQWQYCPAPLLAHRAPDNLSAVIANTWNAFAFYRRGVPLITIEHHCVLDPAFSPYRSPAQAAFHRTAVAAFEHASMRCATRVVAVSQYTADSIRLVFGRRVQPTVILNGIDTDYFCPDPAAKPAERPPGRFRLLFVGNPSRRKGADRLPAIMAKLGDDFELSFTSGLRDDQLAGARNMRALGKLSLDQLRDAYRQADCLLFPSRFEGFGYAAAEAMACGTAVVCSRGSALPEVVTDGEVGLLCPVDDIDAFCAAVRRLAAEPATRRAMGQRARKRAVACFDYRRMARDFESLLAGLP